jgi:hypothetical protein
MFVHPPTTEAWRRGSLTAAASAGIAGTIYVATMYPGLVGIGDTPKLQFVGSVLGTPHSPGYPLYIMLSWVFAQIPIGTLAYRINLLSVVCGAVAAGLLALVLRELGCRALTAIAGALAISLGSLYWSQSILAEVYALNAVLFAGVLLFLLRWSRTRARRDLYCAIAFFGAGLAHHLTLAMTAPALLLFALAVDRRIVTSRVIIVTALACALGLSCYTFIWIRTSASASFLEARAQSVQELVDIISGKQFHRALFDFSMPVVFRTRVPLVASWIGAELRWPGLLLIAVALAGFWRERRAELGLLLGAAAIVTFFALNYNVFDVQVFLLIPMMALGLVAALGLEVIARRFDAIGAPASFAIAALLLPALQYRANIQQNNQRRHTFEMRYFEALFDRLPQRSAIVAESYPINNMVLYELIGEQRGRGRRVELIRADPSTIQRYLDDAFTVFAFSEARNELEFDGVSFQPVDLALPVPRSWRHVADTEAPELALGLSVATSGRDAATSGDDAPVPPEPFTGALWHQPAPRPRAP